MEITSQSKEVLAALKRHLTTEMPELREILLDFPEANQQLKYPSLSILTKTTKFERYKQGDILRKGEPAEDESDAEVLWIVGSYDWSLQLDFWCANKEDRHRLYERFFQAFHSQFPVMGLSLRLDNYYGVLCRYEQNGYSFEGDNQEAAQRKEWRLIVSVTVQGEAIIRRSEYLMQTGETHFDTLDGASPETDEVDLS